MLRENSQQPSPLPSLLRSSQWSQNYPSSRSSSHHQQVPPFPIQTLPKRSTNIKARPPSACSFPIKAREAKSRQNIPIQEKFRRGVLKGARIFLTPFKTTSPGKGKMGYFSPGKGKMGYFSPPESKSALIPRGQLQRAATLFCGILASLDGAVSPKHVRVCVILSFAENVSNQQ